MAADASNGVTQRPSQQKRCFVVSEYGRTETERLERSQVLRHLIRKVLEPLGYDVKRADEIDDPGQITHQVIERLIDDELVVADLTNRNPNVFYELAVRHAARRPVVTIMAAGQDIPFDVKDVRTVFYDLHDPDKLELAQRDLTEKVRAIEANPTEIRNPITVASDLSVLRRSDDPEARVAGALLDELAQLREEIRSLGGRLSPGLQIAGDPTLTRAILDAVDRAEPLSTHGIVEAISFSPASSMPAHLSDLQQNGYLVSTDQGWIVAPRGRQLIRAR
jgi:hypothetical protein